MNYASLRSIASYIPQKCIPNAEFEKTLDTSDEWITKRTGIKTRYFASESQKSSDLGVEAAKLALQRAKLKPSDIDMVICATLSPDFFAMPSNACIISAQLGIRNKPAFDIVAACSGFIYLLSIAKSFIESGAYQHILIIGAEKISSVLDFSDRSTCVLFGDGAGAAVISSTTRKAESIIDVHISADGDYKDLLRTLRPTASRPPILEMRGNEVFKLAVKTIISDAESILQKNNITADDLTYFIPHQANSRILSAVAKHLNLPDEKVVLTVHKYGNTSAASIPMAIDEVYNQNKLKNGDLMLLDAFGGGLTWGSALLYFGGE